MHVAVYAARPDAGALVHTHSEHADGLERAGDAARGSGCTAPFAPVRGSDEIARAAVAALGDRVAVLLGGHGVLALGETPAAALAVCVAVEASPGAPAALRDPPHTSPAPRRAILEVCSSAFQTELRS